MTVESNQLAPKPVEVFAPLDECSFDVFEELLGNKEKIATFSDQNGDITFQVLTGVNKWRFTNVDTGKSIVVLQ